MKNKSTLLIVIALLLSGLFFYKIFDNNNSSLKNESLSSNSSSEVSEAKVDLIIDFGNGNIKNFNLIIGLEDTAFSVLKTIAEKENINLEIKQYDFGVFVEKIDEFESTAKKSWIYYVNGNSGQVAADQNKLNAGDKVEWKYEIPKP